VPLAIICEELPAELKDGVTYVRVQDAAEALGVLAANFHDSSCEEAEARRHHRHQWQDEHGHAALPPVPSLGYKCGLISTVEIRIGQRTIPSTHTTPDAVRLNELLAEMVAEKVTHCFMEVSSHSVVQERIAGLQFVAAVFMNITHDHLDYHGTFAEYIKAKKRFFDQLPASAFALVNADDANSAVMLQNTKASQALLRGEAPWPTIGPHRGEPTHRPSSEHRWARHVLAPDRRVQCEQSAGRLHRGHLINEPP
jgi:UDP-N-acetylmuramoyl-L-alanyl-D-glutamate--2,6-diaminopimelate ligase